VPNFILVVNEIWQKLLWSIRIWCIVAKWIWLIQFHQQTLLWEGRNLHLFVDHMNHYYISGFILYILFTAHLVRWQIVHTFDPANINVYTVYINLRRYLEKAMLWKSWALSVGCFLSNWKGIHACFKRVKYVPLSANVCNIFWSLQYSQLTSLKLLHNTGNSILVRFH